MSNHPAITLSRTLGSGGSLIGYHVAQHLGWRYCDRSILRKTAAELGLDTASLLCQEEQPRRFSERLLRFLAVASPEVPYGPPLEVPLYGQEIFRLETRIMENLLEQAPAVLVGRGGFFAFRGRPRTLHVHVQADLDFRVERLLRIGKAHGRAEAQKLLQRSDRDRAAFVREISGLAWPEPGSFDLILDPSRDGFEACEARVLETLEARLNQG